VRPRSVTLSALIAAAYVAVAVKTVAAPPDGDEPRYLLMAHSLAFDGDVNLANNLARQDYRSFDPAELSYEMLRPFGQTDAAYAVH
jgi:hypothetical protein